MKEGRREKYGKKKVQKESDKMREIMIEKRGVETNNKE